MEAHPLSDTYYNKNIQGPKSSRWLKDLERSQSIIQGNVTPSKHRSSTAASPGCLNTPKTKANDLKCNLIKLIDCFKVEMN